MPTLLMELFRKNGGKADFQASISDEVIDEVDKHLDDQLIRMNGSMVPLKDLEGDCSFFANDITLAQIGWIMQHKKITYAAYSRTKWLALGLKNEQPEHALEVLRPQSTR